MHYSSRLPRSYVLLGLAGLIPFLAGPLLMRFGQAPFGLLMFSSYSLVIASFMAGSWWGIALTRGLANPWLAVASNVIAVVAFIAQITVGPDVSLPVLAGLYLLLLLGDLLVPELACDFRGYRSLRSWLTLVVLVCHGMVLVQLPG